MSTPLSAPAAIRRAILQTAGARVIGIDRDQERGRPRGAAWSRTRKAGSNWSRIGSPIWQSIAGDAAVDGIVFDLGVSSMQLDEAERGFSFRLDGPLDMRMGRDGPSAADVIARASERDLAAIIATLGEERHARAVARAIVKARSERAIETTRALADIVARVVHARDSAIHPATRTFQALRIFVNDELAELAHGLAAAERVLKPAGRLVVVSFHSLEDRIVKTFLTERSRAPAGSRHQPEMVAAPPSFRVLTRRPETPDEAEIAANPRARSAKLRAAERTEAAARTTPARRSVAAAAVARRHACGGAHDPAHAQFRRDRRARFRRGLRLSHQIRLDRAGGTARQAAQRSAPRARRHRGVARRMGRTRQSRRASRRWPSAICSSSRSRRRNSTRSIICRNGRRKSSRADSAIRSAASIENSAASGNVGSTATPEARRRRPQAPPPSPASPATERRGK